MPVIKSAIKKLRKDKKREKENNAFRNNVEQAIKKAKKGKTVKLVSEAFSLLDKSVKKNLLHKNKAARVKSALSKLITQPQKSKSSDTKAAKPTKKKILKKSAKKTTLKK